MKRKLLILITILFASHIYAQDSITIKQQSYEQELKQLPVLFMQTSAEYRALCYQAFNTAAWRLEKLLKNKKRKEKWAIVTDIDETILDNSYEEAKRIKTGKEFNNADWNDWVNKAAATEVPGATRFLQWVQQQGIAVFYISNRDTSQVGATIRNLQSLNLPDADTAHLLFLANTSSKEARRQAVLNNYKIVMLLGDNLNDFTTLFEKKDIATRKAEVDNVQQLWGDKFIVLPNANYGEWENALYDYNRKLTPKERNAKRKSLLKDY
ncbi:MAG TPA: 5'-nucleotidase, lipoprotein e(P4) family [Ferruginibacter sp.]|nr:5'-nucleotidase, lipoprotein e(P4) family [Ferruginibacter sp.]